MDDSEDGMHQDRVRVLVVDDEPAICKALTTALDRAGYDAVAAHSGDAALARLAVEHFDMMLVDLRIPDTRGDILFELAAATHPHLRHRTVFMTGDLADKAQKLVASCRCEMLKKPFELKEMIAVLGSLAPQTERDARGQSA